MEHHPDRRRDPVVLDDRTEGLACELVDVRPEGLLLGLVRGVVLEALAERSPPRRTPFVEPAEGVDEAPGSILPVLSPREDPSVRELELLDHLVEDGPDQGVAGAEVVDDRGPRDVGSRGNRSHARPGDAPLLEELGSGPQDPLPRRGGGLGALAEVVAPRCHGGQAENPLNSLTGMSSQCSRRPIVVKSLIEFPTQRAQDRPIDVEGVPDRTPDVERPVDRDLVERAQRGDQAAFVDLVRMRGDRLFAIAYRILRDVDRAEDALQDALVIAWRDLRDLRDPDRFDAWAARILTHVCIDHSGRERRRVANLRLLPLDERPAPDELLSVADRDQLDRGFRRLTPEERSILVLRYNADWPEYFGLWPDTPEVRAAATGDGEWQAIIVVPDVRVADSTCGEVTMAGVGLTAEEITTALSAREGLTTGAPLPITIDGLDGRSIDVALDPAWTGTCPGFGSLPVVATLVGTIVQPGHRHRLVILDLPSGGNVGVTLTAVEQESFGPFLDRAMPILESFDFAGP